MQSKYKDKYFSVLGDSSSTLEGYSVPQHAAFYDTPNKLMSGVFLPAHTWWGMVLERLGRDMVLYPCGKLVQQGR